MLTHISIRNFAIINETELELGAGMTALTGETGAGKSILLDALGLVLGDRADSSSVKDGAERADISAEFNLDDCAAAHTWLHDQALDDQDTCILRRTLSSDGRSRGFINGQPATLGQLRELGEMLVDIHGQHEHQSLLKPDQQRLLLDDYAGHGELLQSVVEAARACELADTRLRELEALGESGAGGLDALRFQVDELRALNFKASEWPELDEEHRRLSHAGDLLQTCHGALDALYESEQAVYGQINGIAQHLRGLLDRDSRLQPVVDGLDNAVGLIDDASGELRDYVHNLDLDPSRLDWLEQRMAAVHQMARKYRIDPEQLPDQQAELEQRLDELENLEQKLHKARAACDAALATYRKAAHRLSDSRAAAANRLAEAVTGIMQRVGISGGHLEIRVEADADARPRPHGQDRVHWLVAANPGQSARPLQKVASGGELSRISLAIQVIAAHCSGVATLIFDEVDSGIGGGVAEAVGEHLRQLGGNRQVLCVTHLAQVAAQAHNHLRVRKQVASNSTETGLENLDDSARVAEIARMLGGKEITDRTMEHAREMLARASA